MNGISEEAQGRDSGLQPLKEAIRLAPQAVLVPSNAKVLPWLVDDPDVGKIGKSPLHLGQCVMSPSCATAMPCKTYKVLAEVTLPPWLVLSPKRMAAD